MPSIILLLFYVVVPRNKNMKKTSSDLWFRGYWSVMMTLLAPSPGISLAESRRLNVYVVSRRSRYQIRGIFHDTE